jgi:hypothetical protein
MAETLRRILSRMDTAPISGLVPMMHVADAKLT